MRLCNAFLKCLMSWEVPKHQKPWFHTGFITFFASLKIINLEAFKMVENFDLSGGTFLHWCNAFLMILMIREVPKHRKPWFYISFITFFALLKNINLEAFKTKGNTFLHWYNVCLMVLMIWEVPTFKNLKKTTIKYCILWSFNLLIM